MLVIAAALLGYSPLTAHTFWLCVLKCKDLNLYLSSCRFLFRLKHSPQKRTEHSDAVSRRNVLLYQRQRKDDKF